MYLIVLILSQSSCIQGMQLSYVCFSLFQSLTAEIPKLEIYFLEFKYTLSLLVLVNVKVKLRFAWIF